MRNLFVVLLISMAAGFLYIVPLIYYKLSRRALFYAFIYWFILGTFIPFVNIGLNSWIKGLLIGEIATIPLMVIFYIIDKETIVSLVLFSGMIGIGISLFGIVYIN
jgi:hypothetical protein